MPQVSKDCLFSLPFSFQFFTVNIEGEKSKGRTTKKSPREDTSIKPTTFFYKHKKYHHQIPSPKTHSEPITQKNSKKPNPNHHRYPIQKSLQHILTNIDSEEEKKLRQIPEGQILERLEAHGSREHGLCSPFFFAFCFPFCIFHHKSLFFRYIFDLGFRPPLFRSRVLG